MMRFQARIPFVDGLNQPDEYLHSANHRPADNFVVSRTREGTPLSLYGDMIWDRTPYDPHGRVTTISFQYWPDKEEATSARMELAREIRWLMFILIYLRPGSSLSNRSVLNYITVLRNLARHCETKRINCRELFSQSSSILEYIEVATDGATGFLALMKVIWRLGPEVAGYIVPGREMLNSFLQAAQESHKPIRQHPPLPSRIYSIILENLNSEFEFISDAFNRLAKLAEDCFENPLIGMPVAKQQIKANKLNITMTKRWETFDELLEKYQLRELWDQFGNVRDRKGLVGVITHIQMICSLQIQAFTGMRHSEVQALPLNCLEQTVRIGSVRYLVRGVVTKLSRGKIKQACWVTSTRGKLAVELAQALARLIYRAKGRSMTGSLKAESQEFLFVTPIYLWKEGRGGKNIPSHLALAPRFAQIKKLLQPTVLESDITELSQIDPHRHWHLEDGTSIGKPWRFTSHQLRRSIALYAHRSGLVSLPSLKRQLQHITQEMSLYYARGASGAYDMANDFTLDNKFRDEWLSAKPLSQYLGYVTHVLSDDQTELFGGHFEWVKASNRHDRSNVYKSRDATFEQFRLGKLAFTITPVGGCTNPGPCDRNPIDVLHVDCIVENCRYLVGNIHKVERMIAIKNRELEAKRKVKVSLPELVHETAELAKLTTAMKKIQSKST